VTSADDDVDEAAILRALDRELDEVLAAAPPRPARAPATRPDEGAAAERTELEAGTVVRVLGHRKGEHRAFVVVRPTARGRVRVCLLGSARWFAAELVDVDLVEVLGGDDNLYARQARRLVAEARRTTGEILTGKPHSPRAEPVGKL
jgi:hypothetical protein